VEPLPPVNYKMVLELFLKLLHSNWKHCIWGLPAAFVASLSMVIIEVRCLFALMQEVKAVSLVVNGQILFVTSNIPCWNLARHSGVDGLFALHMSCCLQPLNELGLIDHPCSEMA
jgi:hypothetical protein